ncbi:MAG: hypothetical protein ABIH09_03995, partial [Candidatus Omnitrophota bacterium]
MLKLKNTIHLKLISLITLCAFLTNMLLTDAANALPVSVLKQPHVVSPVEIPFEYASVDETHKGTNGKTVIHIQDAHCIYSCQQAIKGLIGHLVDKNDFDLALLEGGSGDYDLSVFTDIKDLPLRVKIADYFLKEGRINGAEFFAITNPDKITLKGLENKKPYMDNLNVYREGLAYREPANNLLKTIDKHLMSLKNQIYSEDLKDFEQRKKDFNSKKIEINEYLVLLARLFRQYETNISDQENLYKLMEVVMQEKNIDFNTCGSERERLIDELTKRLSDTEAENLIKKILQFSNEAISGQEFYSYLLKKAETSGINARELFPNLLKYKRYVEVYESIDSGILFKEIKESEQKLEERLCANNAQKALYEISAKLTFLEKLFSITLTIDDYKYYQKNQNAFTSSQFVAFLNSSLTQSKTFLPHDLKILDVYQGKMEEFYEAAFKRDKAFISNIKTNLKSKDKLIVVSGGFHSENLKGLLKKNGYSYISVMPKFDGKEESPYLRLLNGGLIEEERIITQAVSAIALRTMFNGADENLSTLAVRLKEAAENNKTFILQGTDGGRPVTIKHIDGKYRIMEEDGRTYDIFPVGVINEDDKTIVVITSDVADRTKQYSLEESGSEKIIADEGGTTEDVEKSESGTVGLFNWITSNLWTFIFIALGCLGIYVLFPKVINELKKYRAARDEKAGIHKVIYEKPRNQIVDDSLAPKARYEETIYKKFPKDWNSSIDLSLETTAGVSGTAPWNASLRNEKIAARIEGRVYDPLFKTIHFNFQPNGKIIPPDDLSFRAKGSPNGTTGVFEYRMNAKGQESIEPNIHLKGIIDSESIKVRPIDEKGELLSNESLPCELKSGHIINFDYVGRVRIDLTIVNYTENIDMVYTQASLPENELRDFPDAFSMDIIKYIRQGLSDNKNLTEKFVELVDVDGMTLREKMDAIAHPIKSAFIPDEVKLQAVVNIIHKYCLINASTAKWDYNGKSWGSTWDEILETGQKIRLVCRTDAVEFILLGQRVGLRAGYLADKEGLAKKGDFIITGEIPHAMAVVEVDSYWELIETTTLLGSPEEGIVTSEGGSIFEGRVESFRSC